MFFLSPAFLLVSHPGYGQADSVISSGHPPAFSPKKITYKSYILPAALVGAGTVATIIREHKNNNSNPLLNTAHKEPSIFLQPENYTAFAPAATVAALDFLGIKGKHKPAEQALLYAVSAGLSSAIVYPLKSNTKVLRPDKTDFQSFPSSHAAIAFVSAEFLRREYGDQSVWYTVGGYAAATATAIIRVARNAHWESDVCAGAGIGIASTTTAYWVYDKIKKHSARKKNATTFILPAVGDNFYGFYLTKRL
ncbi:phosphoesterase [Niabella soli DSM 19437]|uniref:Phosphoesterase n=1 Tax=Niabella soli DSM 19437 TaxID=929713 RepID=W0EYC3_9BACT|nr:phosphoesterase [Niabella soli DSM 19437]